MTNKRGTKWASTVAGIGLSILCGTQTAAAIPAHERAVIVSAVERNVTDETLRPCFVRLLRAIRKAENGRHGFEFGVEHHRAEGFVNQAGWCAAIVMKRWDEWVLIQAEAFDGEPFLHYLARRYCPANKEVWLTNVVWFLENEEAAQ